MSGLKKAYLPLCSYTAQQFGQINNAPSLLKKPLFWSAFYIWSPAIITLNLPPEKASPYYLAVFFSMIATLPIEKTVPRYLKKHNVSSNKGGQILRAAQIAGFVVPFATAVAIDKVNDNEPARTADAFPSTISIQPN